MLVLLLLSHMQDQRARKDIAHRVCMHNIRYRPLAQNSNGIPTGPRSSEPQVVAKCRQRTVNCVDDEIDLVLVDHQWRTQRNHIASPE